uniref:Uncharacterized protein n=1 Tax=Siphoviridae sp. ct1TR2 TaxID=2825309 RepID=A0A8S5NU11_9CAUD|nr:MAG TPA: hypothetical protein [Siphoviridae sp. ct1TR2]
MIRGWSSIESDGRIFKRHVLHINFPLSYILGSGRSL